VKEVRGWHELAHRINYAHRVIRELLSELPATEVYADLRAVCLDFKAEAENKLIVTPEQILKQKEG